MCIRICLRQAGWFYDIDDRTHFRCVLHMYINPLLKKQLSEFLPRCIMEIGVLLELMLVLKIKIEAWYYRVTLKVDNILYCMTRS